MSDRRGHARYELLTELGRGGMGVVHRALDNLTGQVVALKHVLLTPGGSMEDERAARQAFASEFATLCSIRHPHIVSVLDYGFDDEGEAFFTMELYEGADSLANAVASETFSVQVDLIVQLLRAIHYLHLRGILHRDLKPNNVLVRDGQVKILDFGVAIQRDAAPQNKAKTAGTLAYMAPEVAWGGVPTEQSDLYSVGVLLFETFAGKLPPSALAEPVELTDEHLGKVDERLRDLIRALLAHDPAERPQSAVEALGLLAKRVGHSVFDEPIAIRESWLRTAPLVGRDAEFEKLTATLEAAKEGRGSTWVVQGQSGVGKSRLVEELRTAALVGGFTVMRGQAATHGDAPYRPWKSIALALVLGAKEIDDLTKAVLVERFPNVARLYATEVEPPPKLEAQAAQTRLHRAIVDLCRAQVRPTLIILEDAHWAGSESLDLAVAVSRSVSDANLVLVVTSRIEEPRDIGALIAVAEVLELPHLSDDDTASLSASMAAGDLPPEVVSFVCRESAGVPLFVLELMRELAQHAGGLERITGVSDAPMSVPSGISRLLRRRLARFPAEVLRSLQTAAVLGRILDIEIMRVVEPEADIDRFLTVCAEALVLDAEGTRWRFSHDKVREALVDDLDDDALREIHRRAAEAIFEVRPDAPGTSTVLVHHWREAGDAEMELRWSTIAAEETLAGGATKEAAKLFERAIELLGELRPESLEPRAARTWLSPDPTTTWTMSDDVREVALVYEGLAQAHFDLGDLTTFASHARTALSYLGLRFPTTRAGWFADTCRSLLTRTIQAVLRPKRPLDDTTRLMGMRHLRLLRRVSDLAVYKMDSAFLAASILWRINHSFPCRPNAFLEETRVYLAFLFIKLGAKAAGINIAKDAAERVLEHHSESEAALLRTRVAVVHVGTANWEGALEELELAEESAQHLGDRRLEAELHGIRAHAHNYLGEFRACGKAWETAYEIGVKSANEQITLWALIGRADSHMRLGDLDEALELYRSIKDDVMDLDPGPYATEQLWFNGMYSAAELRAGNHDTARKYALAALTTAELRDQLCYWLLQGQCAMTEALVGCWSETRDRADAEAARRAVKQLERMSAVHPHSLPAMWFWRGEVHRIREQHWRARHALTRAHKWATRQTRPYEEALAMRSLALLRADEDAQRGKGLLTSAETFDRLGARYEAREVERLI